MLEAFATGKLLIIVTTFLSICFVVFVTLPIHEYAHARVAYWLGDPTAKYNGRLTINPLRHIDPFGAMMIALFGFGYAKGVPVNPSNFKDPKNGMALTALAGPVSNFMMAFIFTGFNGLVRFLEMKGILADNTLFWLLSGFFFYASIINLNLGVFNFIPIPPLDGSKIIYAILPRRIYYKILALDRYSMYLIIGFLLLVNRVGLPLDLVTGPIVKLFFKFWELVFQIDLGYLL